MSAPKSITEKKNNEVKDIIFFEFENKQEADAIKSAIFESGIKYSMINKLYNMITKEENLVVNVKEVKQAITEALEDYDFTFKETYAELIKVAESIQEDNSDAKTQWIMSILKKLFEENDAEFPRRPAPVRGRMGVIAKAVINTFVENKEATEEDLKKAIEPHVKSIKNATDYAKQYYKIAYAIANNMTANVALTHFAKLEENEG